MSKNFCENPFTKIDRSALASVWKCGAAANRVRRIRFLSAMIPITLLMTSVPVQSVRSEEFTQTLVITPGPNNPLRGASTQPAALAPKVEPLSTGAPLSIPKAIDEPATKSAPKSPETRFQITPPIIGPLVKPPNIGEITQQFNQFDLLGGQASEIAVAKEPQLNLKSIDEEAMQQFEAMVDAPAEPRFLKRTDESNELTSDQLADLDLQEESDLVDPISELVTAAPLLMSDAFVDSESMASLDSEPVDTPKSDAAVLDLTNLDRSEKKSEPEDLSLPESLSSNRPVMRTPKPIVIEPELLNGLSSKTETAPEQSPSRKTVRIETPSSSAERELQKLASVPSLPVARSMPAPPPIPAQTPLDPSQVYRAQRVDLALQYYLDNPESVSVRGPWAVMHALLPFGVEADLMAGTQRVNAIAWLCSNRVCSRQQMFSPVGQASFRPNVGDGVQGHEGQFLAMLAQSKVPSRYPIVVSNRQFSIENLVQYEMATCRPRTELTFKLIGLSYYLGTQQSWRSSDRQSWNIERLVAEEMAQPINGAACGGTHRLMGISFALKQRREENQPLSGRYAAAERYIQDYIQYAWSLQNPDGSFSTEWLEARAAAPKDDRKVQTTGHILEWLLFATPAEGLKNRRVDASIDYLISQVYDKRNEKWAIGPRGHALRALALYRQKCIGQTEPLTSQYSMAKAAYARPTTNR